MVRYQAIIQKPLEDPSLATVIAKHPLFKLLSSIMSRVSIRFRLIHDIIIHDDEKEREIRSGGNDSRWYSRWINHAGNSKKFERPKWNLSMAVISLLSQCNQCPDSNKFNRTSSFGQTTAQSCRCQQGLTGCWIKNCSMKIAMEEELDRFL